MSSYQGFLLRAQFYLVILGALYVIAVGLLTIPFIQSHVVYLNAVRIPWFADFSAPEKYGLAPNKTLNFKIRTDDNETLGAWFILSDPYYHSLPRIPVSVEAHVTTALKQRPTILFFHGNAATRAFHVRISHYQAFSSRLGSNVLVIDYRGFAESTGQPSEKGLVRDGKAAWDWLISQGANQENIVIVGHSLGTGVASQLGVVLGQHNITPRGIVLLSPFSSIRELLNTYNIFGVVPLMKPLAMIPHAPKLLTQALIHEFDSLSAVPNIKASILIAHAENDWDIPYTHSEVIFETFLDTHLPSISPLENPLTATREQWSVFNAKLKARSIKRRELVSRTVVLNFGQVEEFVAEGRKVVYVKTLAGGHDFLGIQEGVQDIIRRSFDFL
ncbi:Alpha/Beta hydrolase protein [Collybia nuda]|uniref:Alpha/Beta hydrolase protein n=1 Tax=Collybia nuda TaxID=64659 RepID=A0A9P5Y649_9AGAR|nr:Alpha/Beta hydrolase protein [Collybia nuda]